MALSWPLCRALGPDMGHEAKRRQVDGGTPALRAQPDFFSLAVCLEVPSEQTARKRKEKSPISGSTDRCSGA